MIRDVVRSEFRSWLARGGRNEWTAETLFAEIVAFLETASEEERSALTARFEALTDVIYTTVTARAAAAEPKENENG